MIDDHTNCMVFRVLRRALEKDYNVSSVSSDSAMAWVDAWSINGYLYLNEPGRPVVRIFYEGGVLCVTGGMTGLFKVNVANPDAIDLVVERVRLVLFGKEGSTCGLIK